MVSEVGFQQASSLTPRGAVLVRLAREGPGVRYRNNEHLHTDEQVLNTLLDVVRRPASHLVNEIQLHQAGNHDTLFLQRRQQGDSRGKGT